MNGNFYYYIFYRYLTGWLIRKKVVGYNEINSGLFSTVLKIYMLQGFILSIIIFSLILIGIDLTFYIKKLGETLWLAIVMPIYFLQYFFFNYNRRAEKIYHFYKNKLNESEEREWGIQLIFNILLLITFVFSMTLFFIANALYT